MEFTHELLLAYGAPGLALLSFAAATIIPLSSEAMLLFALSAGLPAGEAFLAGSVGNCAGCMLNYALGRFLHKRYAESMRRSRWGKAALRWLEKYGTWSLLASWLPLIGDPLTIAAGIARVHPAAFAGIVFSLRVLRYGVFIMFF